MVPSRVRQKWRSNKPASGTIVHSKDPAVCELVGLIGFDCVWLDLEHHDKSDETAENLVRALRVGATDCVARPGRGEFARAARLLEAGAKGIIYPRCESADEAREIVRWTKFAPIGARGFGGANADMPFLTMNFADYVRQANDETFVIIQIESPAALACVDDIAAVSGVDALLLGAADYSLACGKPGQFGDPELAEAAGRVAAAGRRAGKHVASIVGTADELAGAVKSGVSLVFKGADTLWLRLAFDRLKADFMEAGFHFEQQRPAP